MNYQYYLKSKDWEEKRRKKLLKKKTCGICGNLKVDIHHLNYKNLFDIEMKDLVRLCRKCHQLFHKLFKEGKIKFKSDNPMSRWVILKSAVKKEMGIHNKNMFRVEPK